MKYLLILCYTFSRQNYYCSAELCVSAELSRASTFHIQTTAKVDSTVRAFCLQATSLEENANFKINLCNETLKTQMWFKDNYDQIRPKEEKLQCIKWKEGNQLILSPACKNDFLDAFLDSKIYNFTFDFGEESCDQEEISIYAVKPTSAKKRYLGFNTGLHIKLFSKSSNTTKWKLKWAIYESQEPSLEPSSTPTFSQMPSLLPTTSPSSEPSRNPSTSPTSNPSPSPTLSQGPTNIPSLLPSDKPSILPSDEPSDEPSLLPSEDPSLSPSDEPSVIPSDDPSKTPSEKPSILPSDEPSDEPSLLPSEDPSLSPSDEPSVFPSDDPSTTPSECVDEEGWVVGGKSDYAGLTCSHISNSSESNDFCSAILNQPDSANFGKTVNEACCICGGSTFKTTHPSLGPTSSPSLSSIPTIEPIPSSQPSDCLNEPNWYFNVTHNLGCDSIIVFAEEDMCERFSNIDYDGKTVMEACCICGGGKHHSRQPSDAPSLSQMPSSLPTESAEPSDIPSTIPSPLPSQSAIPSSFPSVTQGSVLDLRPCMHGGECKSQTCSEEYKTCVPGVSLFTPLMLPLRTKCLTLFNLQFFLQVLKQNVLKDGFEFPRGTTFYSANGQYTLELTDTGLELASSSSVDWRTDLQPTTNKCILHDNGNLVIYNDRNEPIWSSLSTPMGICEGHCSSASSCSLGLECYQPELDTFQDPLRRFLSTIVQSDLPSNEPSSLPSNEPSTSNEPSSLPSNKPSTSNEPSSLPSNEPSTSNKPSSLPSLTSVPSDQPSMKPSLSMNPSAFVSQLKLPLHLHLHYKVLMHIVVCSLQIPHHQNPQWLLFLAALEKTMVEVTAMTKVHKMPIHSAHLPTLLMLAKKLIYKPHLDSVKEIVIKIVIAKKD